MVPALHPEGLSHRPCLLAKWRPPIAPRPTAECKLEHSSPGLDQGGPGLLTAPQCTPKGGENGTGPTQTQVPPTDTWSLRESQVDGPQRGVLTWLEGSTPTPTPPELGSGQGPPPSGTHLSVLRVSS